MLNEVPKAVWNLVFGANERKNIFREVDRMCLVPRLLGLSPQVLRQDSFRISFLLLIFTISHVILAFFLVCYSATVLDAGDDKNFIFQGLFVVNIFGNLLSPFAVVCPLLKLRHLNSSLSNISLVDVHLKRLGYTFDRTANQDFRIARWVHWGLCFGLNPLMMINSSIGDVPWLLVLSWPNFMITVILQQIISLLGAHRARMDALVTAAKDVVSFSVYFKNLEELIRCHSLLCKSASLLNEVYTVTFLLMCTCSFTSLVCNLYFAYFYIFPDHFSAYMLSVYLSWVGIEAFLIWRLTSNCAVSSDKAQDFNNLLYQLMLDDKSNSMVYNTKLRLHIAMKRNIVFTAYGFFNLDYTFIHTIIAAATTYLVILVQFDQPTANPVTTTVTNVTTTPFAGLITTLHK